MPQDQTIFGDKKGNCWAACLASILDTAVSVVPNFCSDHPEPDGTWFSETNKWLKPMGLCLIEFTIQEDRNLMDVFPGIWIAAGKSPRGDFDHCVIYRGGMMIHDPHPSRDGLDGKPKTASLLFPLDPSEFDRVQS
jgi:hypothetical protein